jgi:hypothetical protein
MSRLAIKEVTESLNSLLQTMSIEFKGSANERGRETCLDGRTRNQVLVKITHSGKCGADNSAD